jgi:pantothenate kinase
MLHVKHIKKVGSAQRDYWNQMMSNMNRKQIHVCKQCHITIHKGNYDLQSFKNLGKYTLICPFVYISIFI